MQFHLNGYEPGDPEVADPAEKVAAPAGLADLPEEVDVLIVGCGPAGLTLAAQLAAFPDIKTCIVEQKSGRLLRGQADGIACRTVEMFNAFGFADRVLKESYWVNEVAFWRPDEVKRDHITRSGRIVDTEEGLSEFPHVILNQARVHDFFLDRMRKAPALIEPVYSHRLLDIVTDPDGRDDSAARPVTVRFERLDPEHEGRIATVRARYVVGCDGARSAVRRSIGRTLEGEAANHAWGVMDVLPVTDFPDIRLKAVIQSAGHGSIVLIPREGGYLVRIYVEMDKLAENERVRDRDITVEDLIAATRRVLAPYAFEVKEVAWWSIYEIGQRLCDKFDDVPEQAAGERLPRVFIAGDACHTHSPKAGQGMNVSMQDAFNLGWKLAAVLRQRGDPQLLHTYSAERQSIARELIDFDREWSTMLMSRAATELDPAEVQSYFVRHGRYTAGTATRYAPSLLTAEPTHQPLAEGFLIGTRFHSAPVIRLADAKPMHLGHAVEADGRWRLFAFADGADPAAPESRLRALCEFLASADDSPVRRHTPAGEDVDAVLDVRAILQQGHRDLALERMPPFLLPRKGRFGLCDYEKIFCPDLGAGKDIFTMRGIDRSRGCLVVVRPDQYIAHVLPLDGHADLAAFFGRFMLPVGRS
ncbi:FAD-binding monooxygenase (plasmid) [Methylobacterium currus]|uniref:FAD-binding monooxygenase n=1 Tax=Methylobacterium currus TaxID=2051553 RepID=UPI001E44A171|nr:FAD-binding monooxygenase [Methylobacterium currus]UHC20178.1 FAD-binding monooxygenase [Methylobacterium currus]